MKMRQRAKSMFVAADEAKKFTVFEFGEDEESDKELSSDDEGDLVIAETDAETELDQPKKTGWLKKNDLDLIKEVLGQIPSNDNLPYDQRMEQINWSNIALSKGFGKNALKTKLKELIDKSRTFRLLREILEEHTGKNEETTEKKKRISRVWLFVHDNEEEVKREFEQLKTKKSYIAHCNDMFKKLSKKEQDLYSEKANALRREKSLKPHEKKTDTPRYLFMQYKTLGGIKFKYSELTKMYANLPNDEKLKWMLRCLQVNRGSKLNAEQYQKAKTAFSKDEMVILDEYEGRPKMKSSSGYNLYLKNYLHENKTKDNFESFKAMFKEGAGSWKTIPQDEKEKYSQQGVEVKQEYAEKLREFFESLPEDRQEYELNNGPCRAAMRKIVPPEMVPNKKKSEKKVKKEVGSKLEKRKKKEGVEEVTKKERKPRKKKAVVESDDKGSAPTKKKPEATLENWLSKSKLQNKSVEVKESPTASKNKVIKKATQEEEIEVSITDTDEKDNGFDLEDDFVAEATSSPAKKKVSRNDSKISKEADTSALPAKTKKSKKTVGNDSLTLSTAPETNSSLSSVAKPKAKTFKKTSDNANQSKTESPEAPLDKIPVPKPKKFKKISDEPSTSQSATPETKTTKKAFKKMGDDSVAEKNESTSAISETPAKKKSFKKMTDDSVPSETENPSTSLQKSATQNLSETTESTKKKTAFKKMTDDTTEYFPMPKKIKSEKLSDMSDSALTQEPKKRKRKTAAVDKTYLEFSNANGNSTFLAKSEEEPIAKKKKINSEQKQAEAVLDKLNAVKPPSSFFKYFKLNVFKGDASKAKDAFKNLKSKEKNKHLQKFQKERENFLSIFAKSLETLSPTQIKKFAGKFKNMQRYDDSASEDSDIE